MRRDDVRFAAAARDDGLRKVSKYTWRAGAAGVVCSALLAVAFGHHVATEQPATAHNSGGSSSSNSNSSAGSSSAGGSSTGSGSSNGSVGGSGAGGGGNGGGQGTIVVPAQPPAPATGGGQVTSGAS